MRGKSTLAKGDSAVVKMVREVLGPCRGPRLGLAVTGGNALPWTPLDRTLLSPFQRLQGCRHRS